MPVLIVLDAILFISTAIAFHSFLKGNYKPRHKRSFSLAKGIN